MEALRPVLPLAGLLLLLAAAVPSPLNAQTLTGVVTDSISGAPLVEATVFLSGTQATATTDDRGRFDFGEVDPGRYVIGFTHPMLEELGIYEGIPLEVEVLEGEEAWVSLTTPSFETVLGLRCALEEKGNTAVAGVVRNEADGVVLPQAQVLIVWEDEDGSRRRQVTETDVSGGFVFCGVPRDRPIELTATFVGRSGPPEWVELGDRLAVVQGLQIGLPSVEEGRELDIRIEDPGPAAQGPLQVEGRIRDHETGEPVADALVRLLGARELETSTDSQGRFRFREVPPGDYELEVQRIGYGLQSAELRLERGPRVALEVRLPSQAVELEEITVTVSPRTLGEEIVRRSGTRRDIFAGRELLEAEERGARVVDLLRLVPGVEVQPLRGGGVCVKMRRRIQGLGASGGSDCILIVVDGVFRGVDLARHDVSEFESIEVLSPLQASSRYGLSGSGGAIILHSRGRGPYRDPARNPEHRPDGEPNPDGIRDPR